MKLTIPIAVILAMTAGAASYGQETTVKSKTKIEADEAQVVMMTGCLRQDTRTGAYMLAGTLDAAGERVTSEAKVKVDVDKDDKTITTETKSKTDNGDHAGVGLMSTYVVVPGNVNLAPHVGHRVQIAAAAVEPGHKDADVKIEKKTTIDPEHGHDSTSRSKTKVEIERGPLGHYTVVSLTPLNGTCAAL